MAQDGKVSVVVISDSNFFGSDVSVEVRDSQLQLVKRSNERLFPLPAGLYELSAVLEDGRRHKQLVHVQAGQTVQVKLSFSKSDQLSENIYKTALPEPLVYQSPDHIQLMVDIPNLPYEVNSVMNPRLLEVTGAVLLRRSGLSWVFGSEEKLAEVPTALIQYHDRRFHISLPINSGYGFPKSPCVVKVEETHAGPHINAWIAKERTVANALQNMLASGYMIDAADLAYKSVELLQAKYSDPTGAALGALILYKVGRLEEWASWMENLARDFTWLADGKVLLARLLYNREDQRERALDLAIQASSQRMLYTECYSLLLDMLRRWPRSIDREDRQQALDKLATQAADVDWESICLGQVFQEEA